MSIARISRKFIDALLKFSWIEPKRHEFRVSSFPYCPILDLEDHNNHEMQEDYSKLHYTGIGTAVHSGIQKIMPLVEEFGQKVIGRWKCDICNKVSEIGMHKEQRKKVVKKCKGECPKRFTYEEIDFKYGLLSGHLDLLSQNDDATTYTSYEFKSTGSKLFVPNSYLERFFPNPKHHVQIKIYSTLLRVIYGIKVTYYNIVYFNRDKPEAKVYTFPFTDTDFELMKNKLDLAAKGRLAVNKWLEHKDAKQLAKIFKYKPCHSRADFSNNMKAYFFGKEECPHLSTCLKNPEKLIKEIAKNVTKSS